MTEDPHQRAERLILEARVAGISDADSRWLDGHLEGCPGCAGRAAATDAALRSLHAATFEMDPALIHATRLRVHQRAAELRKAESPQLLFWLACVLSCAWMIISTPYVWRSLEWIAGHLGIPRLLWQMGFGLWWLLPALALAALMSELKPGGSERQEAVIWPQRRE